MKTAYHYDYKTLIYQGESQVHKVTGYDEYILPQLSTWVAKPTFDEETEQAKFDLKNQKWLVELKPVEVTAYNKQSRKPKVLDDASLVTDQYTLEKPFAEFDEWINDHWVANENNKYIAEYDAVDTKRRCLFAEMCDPLKMEALDMQFDGKHEEAEELQRQARAAKEKIKLDNPWPERPTQAPK